ncbi:uncharacterized protein E0L32_009108 [Thyridium curvatum]|uniref:Zn(2)-C6 fungal-type domain-containing protein n=1 Tax=Thyridium curvatum TaxID=1093900 RepID=A0A507AHW7_9PEZI|nr:uncharacterized protein E0L32_009108 [Thyridium curvatum]TPX09635.1 hypothetical protein E0L32_009108 [Thyridium curvatum]
MSSAPSTDEAQGRRESSQAAPRQQLPSLSSLLGQLGAPRPLHSPLSERPAAYSTSSPLDRPQGGAAPERSFSSSSYFPPSAASSSSSQPRTTAFDAPRFDERGTFPSLSRTPFPGPLSPRGREPDYHRPEPQSDYRPGSQWSTPNEYSLGSREPSGSFRPPPDRYSPHMHAPKPEQDGGMYSSHPRPHHVSGTLPPTPTSTAASEGIPAKDGLGPKIWTGSQFLPRFVRAAEVPGEGLCYFYDDGSHCKTVIDGEPVNAHWGVTKAGKPRKRLAIACITCREKKIKCDPDYPRCVQCEKFGRICKFKNAPRGTHNISPSTPPAEAESSRRMGSFMRPPPGSPRPGSTSSASVSPRTTLRPASPENLGGPPKRMRIGYEQFPPPLGGAGEVGAQRPSLGHPSELPRTGGLPLPWQQQQQQHHYQQPPPRPELPRLHEDVLARAWHTDPYVSDPQSVSTTVASFFVHMDSAALRFLPDRAFKSWLQTSAAAHNRKSSEDTMLVYSILALGVALSAGNAEAGAGSATTTAGEQSSIAYEYAQVARYAMDRAKLSIQLVQARLVLSLYYSSTSYTGAADDMLSGAISAASSLQLNVEFEKSPDASMDSFPYGLNRHGYAECRRRTFWACFLLERLGGAFPVRPSIINTEDIFLRLPCDTSSFEEQAEAATPPFEPNFSAVQQRQGSGAPVGVMGYLVQIAAIWGDVMACAHRVANRAGTYSDFDFIKFHHLIISRLEDWNSSLPARLVYSAAAGAGLAAEDRGCFVAMHLAYHMTVIKLHRHVHARFLTSAASRAQYSRAACTHAHKLLDLWCSNAGSNTTPAPPFAAAALLEAADVCSAEGAMADLPQLLDSLVPAQAGADAVAGVWGGEAGVFAAALRERADRLARALEQHLEPGFASAPGAGPGAVHGVRVYQEKDGGGRGVAPGWRWQVLEPIEGRFPREMDCVYTGVGPYA